MTNQVKNENDNSNKAFIAFSAICDYPYWNGKEVLLGNTPDKYEIYIFSNTQTETQFRLKVAVLDTYVVFNWQTRGILDEQWKTDMIRQMSHEEAVGYVYMQNLASY